MRRTARSFLLPLSISLALLSAAVAGCVTEDDDGAPSSSDLTEVQDELLDSADALQSGESSDQDVPYGCSIYGDCAYCDSWISGYPCPYYCYSYSCANGDQGGQCHRDCSLQV